MEKEKLKVKKLKGTQVSKIVRGLKKMQCQFCDREEQVSSGCLELTCSACVQEIMDMKFST